MADKKPNIIVFFTDQQRWDTTGIHGNPLDLTPNFDRMAQRGTHIYNSFTCQPVCGPARSCLQTGMYATQTGCYRNGIPLPPDSKTLAHYFRDGGYQTAYIGKWHLAEGHGGPVPEAGRGGYEYWRASNLLEFTSDAYDTVVFDNEEQPVKLPGYRVDALTDAAIDYVDDHQDNPFFMFISFIEPHHQNHRDDYPAPDGYEERYRSNPWIPPDLAALGGSTHQHLPGYYGMVKRLDEALGRLLDSLRSLNMLDDTIILFTSDHGNHFKTRNNEYKRAPHDSAIRVPTAFHGRGFTGGGRITEPVSLIDLPPTLLDAAGLPIPEQMAGRSILKLLNGATDWPEEMFVQISESQVGRAVRTQRWKYSVSVPDGDGWNQSGSETYTEEFLYDLLADPYELNNLIGLESHQEVSQVMRERLARRMVEAGEAAPTIQPAPKRIRDQLHVSSAEART
jgi:arylsulfatase A-like enzyme